MPLVLHEMNFWRNSLVTNICAKLDTELIHCVELIILYTPWFKAGNVYVPLVSSEPSQLIRRLGMVLSLCIGYRVSAEVKYI